MFSRLTILSVTLFVFLTLPVFAAEPAPDFTLPTFPDGTEISLKDFRGRVCGVPGFLGHLVPALPQILSVDG